MSASVNITCEADCYLDQFENEDLIKEMGLRMLDIEADSGLIEVHRALLAKDYDEAQLLLERLIWPKWRTVSECQEDFNHHCAGLDTES